MSISIPRPSDLLWLVTDGAVKSPGISPTLDVQCNGSLQVASKFSAKLKKRQVSWIPCEIEALCIAVSLQHFSPYIIQSLHPICVLTDSKPCVQAYDHLLKGNFLIAAASQPFCPLQVVSMCNSNTWLGLPTFLLILLAAMPLSALTPLASYAPLSITYRQLLFRQLLLLA